MISRRHQRGYLVITVVVALFLLATISVMLTHGSAINANTASSELEADRADFVTQAGMQHALWRATYNACMGGATIPTSSLGADRYTATISGADTGTKYVLSADQDAWIRSDDPARNNGTTVTNHVRFESGNTEQLLTRFDLSAIPANSQIFSATGWFHLKANKDHPEGPITVHEVTTDWDEATATWNAIDANYRAGAVARIPAQDSGGVWVAVNLTGLVQGWINGQSNNGILLQSQSEGTHTEYTSREDGTNPPRLEVIAGTGSASPVNIQVTGTTASGVTRTLARPLTKAYQPYVTMVVRPDPTESQDAEIYDQSPNNNYGDAGSTWVSSASNDTTRTLIRFNLNDIPKGARIIGATLALSRQSGAGGDDPISAHRITNYWSESDVSWRERESGVNWDSQGADFDSSPVSTTLVGSSNQAYEWDLTSLVQGWIEGQFPNHGVILVAAESGLTGEQFYTSDQGTFTRRPSLLVQYACECGEPCVSPRGSGNILLVRNQNNPTSIDTDNQARLESWGYTVNVINDWASQSEYNTAIASNDVAFVSAASPFAVDDKLNGASIGIVNARGELIDNLGIATGYLSKIGTTINVDDNSHYITAIFRLGALNLFDAAMSGVAISGGAPAGAHEVASWAGESTIVAIDQGTSLAGGGTAAGRRVVLPLGSNTPGNWNHVTNSGELIIARAISWAMGEDKGASGSLLMVVANDNSLTAQENAKKLLMESWGYAVNVIDEDDSQAEFDTAFAANDVVFVTEDVIANDVNIKLTGAPVGVVTEEANLVDDLGMGDGIAWDSGNKLDVVDNSHYIMQPFAMGTLGILNSNESLAYQTPNLAPDLMVLAHSDSGPGVTTVESGAELVSGLMASGRRVLLPWGGNNMDVNSLNEDGLTVFRRSLEWGAGAGPKYGLIAHWKLDEDSGLVAEDSAGGHDGALANGPAWVPAIHGGGLSFDGNDDAIVVPNNSTLSLVNKMTFAAWVRSDNFGQSGPYDLVVSKGTVATTYAYYFGALGDEIIFGFSDGIYREFVTPDLNLATDTWHHIAATFDNATNQVRLYHNGTEVLATTTSYEPTPTTHDLYIGSSEDGADWDGELDDVRIYRDVLTADEIAELAALPPRLPIAHWKLDDTSGATAVDSAGGHDGTLANGPQWRAGHLDNALQFDGSNDRINVPHDNELNLTSQMTLSAWVYSESLDGFRMVLTKGNNGVPENYWLGTDRDGVNFGFVDGGTYAQYTTSGLNLQQDQWHHIAATFDNANDEVKLYLDGSVETFSSTNSPAANNENLIIGSSYYAGESFDGLIDDVRIYNVVLDDAEIAALASAGGSNFGGGGGGADYVERSTLFTVPSSNAWQTVDLSVPGVPPNAVVEIAMENTKTNAQLEAGVREVGGSGPTYDLHEPEGGGVDALVKHVQADNNGHIQAFAEDASEVQFRLMGYWTGVDYTNLDGLFTVSSSGGWRTQSLSGFGVQPGQVVEIIVQNTNGSQEYHGGVRKLGSGNEQMRDIQEAEAGGKNFHSVFVEASNDAAANIQAYAENTSSIEFKPAGAWVTPPGSYVEHESSINIGSPTSNNTWQTVNLTSYGVPPNAVLQITLANRNTSGERRMGVRAVGSSLDRYVDLHEAESGGEDLVTFHVKADSSSRIEWYHERPSDSHRFYLMGWWVLQ